MSRGTKKKRTPALFTECRLMGLQENGWHVIESEVATSLYYVAKGGSAGIVTTTKDNGYLVMDIDQFIRVAKEAQEVFQFWKD
jgi:hypothetical protein